MKKKLLTMIGSGLLLALPTLATSPLSMANDILQNGKTEIVNTVNEAHYPMDFSFSLPTRSDDAPHLITEVPEGDLKYYLKDSSGYEKEWTAVIEHSTESGARIVFTEDGDVYFDNFLANAVSPAWIKGKLSEDGTSIRVDFPQDYYILDVGDTQFCGSLWKGEVLIENGEVVGCHVDSGENYVTFSIDSDGSIVMEDDAEIVMKWNDNTFSGYSDNMQLYTPIEAPLSIPTSVATEEWTFLYANTGCFVEVGEDGNNFYMQGFSELFPQTAIKGEVENDKIIIDPNQFLGFYYASFVYLMFGYITPEGLIALCESEEKFVFNYDKDAKIITPDNPDIIWFANESFTDVMYVESFFNPIIKDQGTVQPASPMAPEFSFYNDYFDEFGEFHLWFSLPPFNVNGDLIHTDNYFYTIYVDDEPYVFESDIYTVLGEMGISEITDIPYSMDLGGGLATLGIYRGVVLLCGGMDKIEVQSYLVVDGEKYYSDKMTITFTGIEKVEGISQVVSTEYYDLTGAKTSDLAKGIVICKTTMSDGTVKVSKQIK